MATYWQKLRDPRWQKRRLEIMQRDHFECRLCYDDKSTLNVHHLRYERNADPWDVPDNSLLTTCESCHEELHAMQFGARFTEALIIGGAGIETLNDFCELLEEFFLEGPHAVSLCWPEWDKAIADLRVVLQVVEARKRA